MTDQNQGRTPPKDPREHAAHLIHRWRALATDHHLQAHTHSSNFTLSWKQHHQILSEVLALHANQLEKLLRMLDTTHNSELTTQD